MAAIDTISVGLILRTVWNDIGAIFARLGRQAVIALSIVVVFGFINSAARSNVALSAACDLINVIAILPFEIAVFRLLILDEAAPGYDFAITTVRFQRMLGWTVAFWVMGDIADHSFGCRHIVPGRADAVATSGTRSPDRPTCRIATGDGAATGAMSG